jgi:hypothetical protein
LPACSQTPSRRFRIEQRGRNTPAFVPIRYERASTMRYVAGHRAGALAGAIIALLVAGAAQAQGFGGGSFTLGAVAIGGGGPAIGAGFPGHWGGAYGGPRNTFGYWGGGGLIGGWGGGCCGGGGAEIENSPTFNNIIVQPPPPKRSDGGSYGGGGVFYPDDGYSRINAIRSRDRDGEGAPDYLPAETSYRPLRHVIELPVDAAGPPARGPARPRAPAQ